MPQRIEVPGHGIVEFPDGMSDEQISAAIKKNMLVGQKSMPPVVAPVQAPSISDVSPQNLVGGARIAAENAYLGLKQLPLEVLGSAPTPVDVFGVRKKRDDLRQEVVDKRQKDAPIMSTTGGKIGNITANVAATAGLGLAAPGARALLAPRSFAEGAMSGGFLGGIQPAADPQERVRNALVGAGGGLAGQVPGALAQHVVRPMEASAQAKRLLQEGILPTPGQAADPNKLSGSMIRGAEERVASLPLVGDLIRNRRADAVDQFNSAVSRRAGGGGTIGQEGVIEANQNVGGKLDSLAQQVGVLQTDAQLSQDLASAGRGLMLEKSHQRMLADQLALLKQGQLTGEQIAQLRTQWQSNARNYANSTNPSQRDLGKALTSASNALDDFVERNMPPAFSEEYRAARRQYAELTRFEGAAARAANNPNNPGVFTPNQYMSEVKSQARGVKRKTVAKGQALGQELATDAMALRDTVPDSGTAGRVLTAAGLGAAGTGAYMANPALPIGVGLGATALYGIPQVNKYAIGGYGWQDPAAEALRNYLRPLTGLLGTYGSPLLTEQK